MKQLNNTYKLHTLKPITNLVTCWKIVLKSGLVYGFTDNTRDITLTDEPDVIYRAVIGFTPTAISSSAAYNVDNLDVNGVLNSGLITEADLRSGVWDFSEIYVFRINYDDIPHHSSKIEKLRFGVLGEIKTNKNMFTAEIRGIMQFLQNNIGVLFQPACRAEFCDTKCGLSAVANTYAGTITSILVSNRKFIVSGLIQSTGYFNGGLIRFSNGLEMEVKTWDLTTNTIELQLPVQYNILINDSFVIVAGCNKSFITCYEKFNNAINFRGEPHIPGVDFIKLGTKASG